MGEAGLNLPTEANGSQTKAKVELGSMRGKSKSL